MVTTYKKNMKSKDLEKAAKEREDAIQEMIKIYISAGKYEKGIAALYDAGYRLVKSDE